MIKKAAAIMLIATMLVAGPVMNHVTAKAYTLAIEKGSSVIGNDYEKKQNNATTGQISIRSGVISGSLNVSARLVRKNANGGVINCMNSIIFDRNSTRSESYLNGQGVKGLNYYLAAKVVDTSRFSSTDITYTFEP